MKTLNILHLSDLHYQPNALRQNNVLSAFWKDLDNLTASYTIDIVVFSGDLVYKGDSYQDFLSSYENFIEPILRKLKIPKGHFLITPGNHDIQRSKVKERWEKALEQEIVTAEDIHKVVTNLDTNYQDDVKVRLGNYYRFLEDKKLTDHYTFSNSVFCANKVEIDGIKIGIANLNTSLRATGFGNNYDYGKLIVGAYQVEKSISLLSGCDITIANFHHPFDWLKDVEKQDIRRYILESFDLVLFGHNHQSDTERIVKSKKGAIVVNAGALYEKSNSFIGYSVISISQIDVTISMRSYFPKRRVFDAAVDIIPDGRQKFDVQLFAKSKGVLDRLEESETIVDLEIDDTIAELDQLTEKQLEIRLDKNRFLEKNLTTTEINKQIINRICNYRKYDLTGFNFEGLDLTGYDFSGINLCRSQFIDSNLNKTFFSDVNLEDASMINCSVSDANFLDVDCLRSVVNINGRIFVGGANGAIVEYRTKDFYRSGSTMIFSLAGAKLDNLLAAGTESGYVYIWNINNKRNYIRALRNFDYPVYSLAFSPIANNILTVTGRNGQIDIYDWQIDSKPKSITFHDRDVLSLAFSPDGRFLASVGVDRKLVITETSTWKLVAVVKTHSKDYLRAVIWLDNTHLLLGGDDGHIFLWTFIKQQLVFKAKSDLGSAILSISYSPSNYLVALGLRNDHMSVVRIGMEDSSLNFNKLLDSKVHVGRIWSLTFTEDYRSIVTAGNEGAAIFWNDIIDETGSLSSHYLEGRFIEKLKVFNLDFKCFNLRINGLKGLVNSGYRVAKNKDRHWDFDECSLQDWLVNKGAVSY